ncbi:hypothetical protein J3R30DRAFT_2578261 [Lentinula aciculospora]|uniref:Anti-proliferative protein domain-containing protein n=1 Tax=Lentinula aciculospora TaxID=153920 RepID=A0A9W9DPZ7_9AGAR|nr:hypothetical protein J3R30DRAFT_2578261 [Lentinula aciculospora]
MHISPISTSSASATFSQLVNMLTRPLAMLYSVEAVSQLQIFLHANFMSMIPAQQSISPFTILLSATTLPPTPIYAACLQAGIAWPEWIRSLGNQVIYILVMDGSLTVRIGESGESVTVWSEDPIQVPAISKKAQGIDSLALSKLRTMLNSARERNASMEVPAQPILLPTLLSVSATSMDIDDESSDSDSESTSSSSRFSEASAESMTSVSSASSSPISTICDLPLVNPSTMATKKTSVYVPPAKLSAASSFMDSDPGSIPSHRLLSRSQRRLARVLVDKSKASVCQYKYQGGQTGVMTGGVMLGSKNYSTANLAPATKSRAPLRMTSKKRSDTVMLGPDSSDWRRVRA